MGLKRIARRTYTYSARDTHAPLIFSSSSLQYENPNVNRNRHIYKIITKCGAINNCVYECK